MPAFRDRLLDGQTVALWGDGALAGALGALGASAHVLEAGVSEADAQARASELGPVDTLVCDLRASLRGGELGAALEALWAGVQEVAVGVMIPGGQGGKVVLIAPAPDAGAHAEAVRAGAENLARTLSVEWARYAIRVTAITPGPGTGGEEIAELVCFLASPGGDYLTGCRLELGLLHAS